MLSLLSTRLLGLSNQGHFEKVRWAVVSSCWNINPKDIYNAIQNFSPWATGHLRILAMFFASYIASILKGYSFSVVLQFGFGTILC